MNIPETEELTQKKSDPLKPLETGQETKKDEPPKPTPKKQSRILRTEPPQKPVNNIQPIDINNFFI
jgi:hypothetical protein